VLLHVVLEGSLGPKVGDERVLPEFGRVELFGLDLDIGDHTVVRVDDVALGIHAAMQKAAARKEVMRDRDARTRTRVIFSVLVRVDELLTLGVATVAVAVGEAFATLAAQAEEVLHRALAVALGADDQRALVVLQAPETISLAEAVLPLTSTISGSSVKTWRPLRL
jgi:hypothetical protein